MNTAVAVTDQICRTVLYLGAMAAGVFLGRPFLARTQVTNPRGRTGQASAADQSAPALNGHAAKEPVS